MEQERVGIHPLCGERKAHHATEQHCHWRLSRAGNGNRQRRMRSISRQVTSPCGERKEVLARPTAKGLSPIPCGGMGRFTTSTGPWMDLSIIPVWGTEITQITMRFPPSILLAGSGNSTRSVR
jgi:hypothetical protein